MYILIKMMLQLELHCILRLPVYVFRSWKKLLDCANNMPYLLQSLSKLPTQSSLVCRKVQIMLVQILRHLPKMHCLRKLVKNIMRLLVFVPHFMMYVRISISKFLSNDYYQATIAFWVANLFAGSLSAVL